ncbi:MAG: hypothetical protein RL020_157 [Pseudomonadota bacterium]|jgi:hypothetical protein
MFALHKKTHKINYLSDYLLNTKYPRMEGRDLG